MSNPGNKPRGRNGEPLKLYINADVRKAADKVAFSREQSLSKFVEGLLKKAVSNAERKALA